MATMKDIARLAKVSQGTVSNVLNNKGNVSVERIKMVMNAAKELNYIINAPASQLRSQSGLAKIIAVILPNVIQPKYSAFFTSVHRIFQELNYIVLLFVTGDSPYVEKNAINTISTLRACGVVTVTSCKDAEEAYEPVKQRGGKVIFVEQEFCSNDIFIGFDYKAAGKIAAKKVLSEGCSNIGLMTGLDYYSSESMFEEGFMEYIKESGKDVSVHSIQSDYTVQLKSVLELISLCKKPDAIVTTGKNDYHVILQAYDNIICEKLPVIIAVVPSPNAENREGLNQYILDYSKLGKKVSDKMAELLDPEHNKPSSEHLYLEPDGWKNKSNENTIYFNRKGTVLNILLAASQSSEALKKMSPGFTKKTGIALNFDTMLLSDLADYLCQNPYTTEYDIVRTNLVTTPSFPLDALVPFEEHDFEQLTATMFPNVINTFSYVENVPCVIPFDISVHFLAYRKDLFSDPIISRGFFEAYGKELKVPTDYEEYNLISKFFTRSINKDSPVISGTTSILGDDTLLFTDFLLRYKNMGGIIASPKGEMVFDRDIAQEAIENYYEMLSYSIISSDSNRKDTGIITFAEGSTAMEHISTSYAPGILDLKKNYIDGRIGYEFLLGQSTYLGGGGLAILSGSKNPDGAEAFIKWACALPQAQLFTLLGGTSPHAPVYKDMEILQVYPWLSLITESVNKDSMAMELSYFYRYPLEKEIGDILRKIYNDKMEITHAGKITEEIFKKHYTGGISLARHDYSELKVKP